MSSGRLGQRRWLKWGLFGITGAAVAMLAWGLPTNVNATPSAAPSASASPQWNTAADDGDATEAYASAHHAEIFGGIFLTDQASHIDVYLTRQDAAAQDDIVRHSDSSGSLFTFLTTPTTLAQQAALHDRVLSDAQSLRDQGIDLRVFGPDTRTGQEVAQVVGLTEAQREYLDQRYGPNFQAQPMAAAEAPIPADRQNDTSPWNGGDFISDDATGDCTSGIPVHNGSGSHYLLTAAHCSH